MAKAEKVNVFNYVPFLFRVTIEKDAIEKLGVCFDHKFVKKDDRHYESRITNFIPKRDLKVYYFR